MKTWLKPLLIIASVAVLASGCSDDDRETVPPEVTATTPAADATGVTTDGVISATFSEPLNAVSVGTDTFFISSSPPLPAAVAYDAATLTATLTPDSPLDHATEYTVFLTTGIEDEAGNGLTDLVIWTFTTAASADATAPQVTGVTPADNAAAVPHTLSAVTVTFDEAMDPATIDEGSVILFNGGPTAGTVSYDAATMTASFSPAADLAFDAEYQLVVAPAVTDLAGNPLAAPFVSSFTVASDPAVSDTTPPQVTGVTPAAGATDVSYQLAAITVGFDEAMDPSTINQDSILVFTDSNTPGTVSYDPVGMTATFTPDGDLMFDALYTVVVTPAAADVAGNALAAPHISTFSIEIDTYPPTISEVTPADGATDVPPDSAITVTFSEDMDPASVSSATVRVSGFGGSTVYDAVSRTATWTPSAPLPWNTTLTGFVSGNVRDLAGNLLGSSFTWEFTTQPDLVAPEVDSVTPPDGSTGVDPQSVLTVSFNEPMDPATIDASSFTVDNGVSGSVTVDFTGTTATFTPTTWLPDDTLLTATVSTGATDAQGNPLAAPHSWQFTTAADTTAPTVTTLHPIDGGRIISRDTVVRVTFSEPMDASSINALSFSVSATSGAVSYDPTTWTATFTPFAPFPAGVTRTVSLAASISDVAGNTVGSPTAIAFEVSNRPVLINGPTSAEHDGLEVAFTASGDGVAVWHSQSGLGGGRILASIYSAASNTWSTESVLASYTSGSVSAPVVTTDGTTFLAAWAKNEGSDQTLASIYSSGSWGPPEQIDAAYEPPTGAASDGGNYAVHSNNVFWVLNGGGWSRTDFGSGTNFRLAGSGNGFAAVYVTFAGIDDLLRARVWAGGAWGAVATIFTGDSGGTSNIIGNIGLVSNGSGYATAFSYFYQGIGFTNEQVITSVYSGGSWTASNRDSGQLGAPRIASDGSGYAVAWTDDAPLGPRGVLASVYASGSWSVAAQLSSFDLFTYGVKGISGNAAGYAVTWNGAGNFDASVYASGSWAPPATLAASSAALVAQESNGSTHNVIWTRAADDAVLYSVHASGVWSDGTLQAAGSGGIEELILTDHLSSGYQAFYAQSGELRNRRLSSVWQGVVDLVQGDYRGHAFGAKLVGNVAGDAMVIWQQYDAGVVTIRARPFSGGIWGSVFEVSASGNSPDVAISDTHAVVVWRDGSANDSVFARRYAFAGGTWNATQTLLDASGTRWPPAVASDGTGFMVIYPTSFSMYHRTSSDGQTWDAEVVTSNGGGVDPELYSNGGSYLSLMLPSTSSSRFLRGRIYSSGAWGSNTTIGSVASRFSSRWAAIPYQNGYTVAWEASGSDVQARLYDGGSWLATETLNDTFSADAPALAADGAGLVCYFRDGSDYVSRAYNGSGWDAGIVIPNSGDGSIAMETAAVATTVVFNDGAEDSVASNFFAGGIWGESGGFIEGRAGAASNPQIIATGTDILSVWDQVNTVFGSGQVWASAGN